MRNFAHENMNLHKLIYYYYYYPKKQNKYKYLDLHLAVVFGIEPKINKAHKHGSLRQVFYLLIVSIPSRFTLKVRYYY